MVLGLIETKVGIQARLPKQLKLCLNYSIRFSGFRVEGFGRSTCTLQGLRVCSR